MTLEDPTLHAIRGAWMLSAALRRDPTPTADVCTHLPLVILPMIGITSRLNRAHSYEISMDVRCRGSPQVSCRILHSSPAALVSIHRQSLLDADNGDLDVELTAEETRLLTLE